MKLSVWREDAPEARTEIEFALAENTGHVYLKARRRGDDLWHYIFYIAADDEEAKCGRCQTSFENLPIAHEHGRIRID